jgi:hypothetical protein
VYERAPAGLINVLRSIAQARDLLADAPDLETP